MDIPALILRLYEVGAVKFGSYKLKSGLQSPVYFDLRVIISYPDLLTAVSRIIWDRVKPIREKFSTVCGVPYTALPIATCVCTEHNIPMLIKRKEAKEYGTMKMIEGYYEEGGNCLIIEDVVTSGSSVFETAAVLQGSNLVVTDAVVLLNREQGGEEMLRSKGITLHSVLTLNDVVTCLQKQDKISEETVKEVKAFITNNNTFAGAKKDESGSGDVKCYRNSVSDYIPVTYGERAELCKNAVARRIFNIMHEKRTNLCLSADVDSAVELVELADLLGPHICILKTHVDILDHPAPAVTKALAEISKKHDFVIFEDRKFADIGSTVRMQYSGGTYAISDWAELTNAHSLPGPGVIEGLKAAVKDRTDRACLLIAEMSSKGNLATKSYTEDTVKMAEAHDDFVIGFICTSKVSKDPKFLHITPGVKLEPGDGQLGQQYLTPDEVIRNRKCDIIVVGRGITLAANRLQVAVEYQAAAWKAYMDRVGEE